MVTAAWRWAGLLLVLPLLGCQSSQAIQTAYKHPIFLSKYGNEAFRNLTAFRSTINARVYEAYAESKGQELPGHARYKLLQPFLSCPPGHPQKSYGVGDGAKETCSPLVFGGTDRPCVVYSLGSYNEFSFEESILANTNCRVYSLDCTVEGRTLPGGRHTFLKKCIGNSQQAAVKPDFWTLEQTMQHFGHQEISLLKMDIEHYEWGVLAAWKESDTLPIQVAFELHYGWPHQSTLMDISFLALHLANLGYGIVSKNDNPLDGQCTELLLLRVEKLFHRSV